MMKEDTAQKPYFVLPLKDKYVSKVPFALKVIVLSEPEAQIEWFFNDEQIYTGDQ